MKYKSPGIASISCLLLATISVCWCIYRDIQIDKQYPGDLRNRVVGSRLQMDGISPYFYHWKPTDGLRYYDPEIHNTTLKISNITASPFFHQLLYPIANLQQRIISKIWLILEYLALLVMTMLALQSAKENAQKWAILFTSLFFLYSYAWTNNIEGGQMYIFIPFVAMLFYFFITRKSLLNAAFAGICAVSLILMRPNTLLFFFPFLFLATRYSRKYKTVFLLSSLLVLLFAFGSSHSRLYWSDYHKAIIEQVKGHQGLNPTLQNIAPFTRYEKWEGWDTVQIKNDIAKFPYKHSGENGNIFVLLNVGLHVKIPIWVLSALCLSFIVFIFLLFYKRYKHTPQFNTYSIALIGFCMYMASDIFSPIHRAQYNASQWIFALLLIAGSYSSSFKKIFVIGILLGLFLNSLTLRLIPMRNTLGEYLIYASIIGLLFTFKPESQK